MTAQPVENHQVDIVTLPRTGKKQAVCSCTWQGARRDFERDASRDRDQHLEMVHGRYEEGDARPADA